jgi:hypothetical protein
METTKKRMSKPVTAVSAILLLIMAFRLILGMMYWWDHSNPFFVLWQGAIAAVCLFLALGFGGSLFLSERETVSHESAIGRFCSQESPVLPTAVGLTLSIAGGYGMLVLVTEENVAIDWSFFGALLGTGLYVLKRTFLEEY